METYSFRIQWAQAATLYVYNWAELDTNCASLGAIVTTAAIHRRTLDHDEYICCRESRVNRLHELRSALVRRSDSVHEIYAELF